jgi:murein DD-endopeptidase MepM/ murein hydrolase activator NlpD
MSSVHVVAPGETLVRIARRYGRPVAEIASANKIAPHAMVKLGDRLVIPGKTAAGPRTAAAAAPETQPEPAVAAAPAPVTPQPRTAEKPPQQKVASLEPTASVRVATPAIDATAEETSGDRGASPAFRWPVRGRVIAGFGAKNNGQQNDGINLAVPEGTAVRAAEDGVVAYAGSELKGYGNLILVRHSNGFVTAYAHASEIMVKRNDPVRRGQVIAKSGQTGTVTSPQLHFEIRKGSAPVDPMQHLPAGA